MAVFTNNSKLDTFYFIYFIIHIPITLLIDSGLVIPKQYQFPVQQKILEFHVNENKDFLLLLSPSWLKISGFVEIFFQLPVFFVGCYSLYQNLEKYYPLLMTYGFNASLTTFFCLWDIYFYDNEAADVLGFVLSENDRMKLLWVYIPTFVIPLVIFVDFTTRIMKLLNENQKVKESKKLN